MRFVVAHDQPFVDGDILGFCVRLRDRALEGIDDADLDVGLSAQHNYVRSDGSGSRDDLYVEDQSGVLPMDVNRRDGNQNDSGYLPVTIHM